MTRTQKPPTAVGKPGKRSVARINRWVDFTALGHVSTTSSRSWKITGHFTEFWPSVSFRKGSGLGTSLQHNLASEQSRVDPLSQSWLLDLSQKPQPHTLRHIIQTARCELFRNCIQKLTGSRNVPKKNTHSPKKTYQHHDYVFPILEDMSSSASRHKREHSKTLALSTTVTWKPFFSPLSTPRFWVGWSA